MAVIILVAVLGDEVQTIAQVDAIPSQFGRYAASLAELAPAHAGAEGPAAGLIPGKPHRAKSMVVHENWGRDPATEASPEA